MTDLKGQAVRGGFAKGSAQVVNFALKLGCLIALARLLEPEDFGLVGMVTAITGGFAFLRDFGLSTATVQRSSISVEQISALFWVNVGVGALLTLASVAAAPLVAGFYREPRLVLIMCALGLGFLFNAAGVQQSAVLRRQMRFTAVAAIDVGSMLVSSAVSVALAIAGFGYWALVAWSLTLPLAATVLSWQQSDWVPARPRRGARIGSLLRFGGIQTLNSIVIYIAYNFDKVLLGRFWGPESVGLYGRAYQLITIPTDQINDTVGSVAIPVLSRLQDDPARLRRYFLASYSLVLALTLPATMMCALFAHEIILTLFGPKWDDAAPVFRLLAPTILVFALINPTGWFLVAVGKVGRSLRLALAIAPIVITGYAIGLKDGAEGVALGFSCAMTLWVIPHLWWCFHGTAISLGDLVGAVVRPMISGAVGALCAVGVLHLHGAFGSPLETLVVGGTVLGAVYVVMLLFVLDQKAFYVDLLRGLRARPE